MLHSLLIHRLEIHQSVRLFKLYFRRLVNKGRFGFRPILSPWQQLVHIKVLPLHLHLNNRCDIGTLIIIRQGVIIPL